MKKTLWILAVLVVFVALAAGISRLESPVSPPADSESGVSTEEWSTFTSDQFDFEIKYPSEWEVAAHPDDVIAPSFNFYKPETAKGVEPPFTHHNDVVQVSVFPDGVPTEGIFGESTTSAVDFAESMNQQLDFILDDGTVWATYANFNERPSSWSEPGFIFTRANIENLEATCLRDGKELGEHECDPLFGDEITRSGTVDSQERAIQVAMMESFKFLESDSSDGGTVCAQVITEARNPDTGIVETFSTPCDVPEGWEVVR